MERTGDIFALYARCTSLGAPSAKTVFAEAANGGVSVLVDGANGFVQHGRSANFEIANDWNSLLLQVDGGTALYSVNGHIVNRVLSVMDRMETPSPRGPSPGKPNKQRFFTAIFAFRFFRELLHDDPVARVIRHTARAARYRRQRTWSIAFGRP